MKLIGFEFAAARNENMNSSRLISSIHDADLISQRIAPEGINQKIFRYVRKRSESTSQKLG